MSSHRSSLFANHRKPGGAAGSNFRERDVEEELHKENDKLVDGISVDMSRLKAAAQTLRDEAAEHNKFLDTLQDAVVNARDGVKSTVGKLDGVMARYGCKDTFTCAGVLFLVILLLYFVVRRWSATANAAPQPSVE